MKRTMLCVAAHLWLFTAGSTPAQQPDQAKPVQPPAVRPAPADVLPAPQEVLPVQPVPLVPPIYIYSRPELGKRNIWQVYSVNSRGQFVPSVVMAPEGYYYAANGQPYRWPILGSDSYMPNAVD